MELLDYTLPYTSYDDPNLLPSPAVTVIIQRPMLDSLAISENPSAELKLQSLKKNPSARGIQRTRTRSERWG